MGRYRFLQLDVFTDKPFSGNPLAVFPEAEGLSDEEMQSIAREMNLSETVFVFASNDKRALRRLRIFTPAAEIPMAGHPVVGTWNALALEGIVPKPEGGDGWTGIMHEINIGVLPVDIEFNKGEPSRVVMTQGKFSILKEANDAKEKLAQALGLNVSDFAERLPIQVISTGLSSIATPLKSLDALGRCRVNSSLLSEINQSLGGACYVFTLETRDGAPSQAHSRLFAPEHNIAEDPATGSAAGALSSYMVYHGALSVEASNGAYNFVIEQGDFMKRPSRIYAEVTGAKGNIEKVRVGGPSVVVATGEVFF